MACVLFGVSLLLALLFDCKTHGGIDGLAVGLLMELNMRRLMKRREGRDAEEEVVCIYVWLRGWP